MQLSFIAFSSLKDSPVFTIASIILKNFLINALIDINFVNGCSLSVTF